MYTAAVVTLALLGSATAQDAVPVLNQLETARLTQAAQRAEFEIEGDTSAFKFKFSDTVRCHLAMRSLRSPRTNAALASMHCS